MYSSRGIGRKVYDDRNGREGKSRSPMSSSGSQSPPTHRSERVRHDSRDRTPLRDRDRLERRRSSRSRSRSRERHSDRSYSSYGESRSRRHSRSPNSYKSMPCRSPKSLTSSSSDFPNSRSRSPSLKSDERYHRQKSVSEEYSPHTPTTPQMGQKSDSEAMHSQSDNRGISSKETTVAPFAANESPVGIDFNINPNASFMPKPKEPSVSSPNAYSDQLPVRSTSERSAKIESSDNRYTAPKPWTPMGRDFNQPSSHSYVDQRQNIDRVSHDGRREYRERDDDKNSPYYTTNVRKFESRSPSPQRSRPSSVYDMTDTKRPNDIYSSRLAVVQEIYGDRMRPRSPSYSKEREARNRSPEYARPNPIADPYGRSRSPEMSQFKREMDASAATYGIDKSGQSRSFFPVDQSPSYGMSPGIRTDPMLPKSTPYYESHKMQVSSPSQTPFGLQQKTPYNAFDINKREPDMNSIEMQQLRKQQEDKLLQEKIAAVFQNINSIDELISLKEAYKLKTVSLDQLLKKSILREGEILRNKRRDRTGYKDPSIIENRNLQNDVRKKIDEVNKFLVEIDKKIRAYNKALKATTQENSGESEKPTNYEAQLLQNSLISTTGEEDNEEEEEVDEYETTNATFEYYDPGSHWCRDCDKLIPKIKDYFDHLHTKDHFKFVINESQPWKKPKKVIETTGKMSLQNKIKIPTKGAQFLVPIRGFYCPLCSQYLADHNTAEEHLKSAKHNRIYMRFTCLNIDYEHKWNSDKGKALSRHQFNEKKRLKEEEQKEIEKKRQKDEQRIKEEKEAKRRKAEEENSRKDKERDRESSREKSEKDYKTIKSENNSSSEKSSDRFRLKGVTLDLNDKKSKEKSAFNKLFGKDRQNDKEKHKKRKRHFSSSSSSSPSSPAEPVKKRTYFGDPYKDPKLKLKPYVPLIYLNVKTARKYHCEELVKVIEESKLKNTQNKSIKMKVDFNIHNEEDFQTNQFKSNINDILNNFDEVQNQKENEKESNKSEINEENKTNESVPQVPKVNDISDSSDAPLVIDTSVSETTNKSDKETDLEKNENKTMPENNSDNGNESAETPLCSDCTEETILPHMETDHLIEENSESVVKNDVSLASAANNIEPNELILNISTIISTNDETNNSNKV